MRHNRQQRRATRSTGPSPLAQRLLDELQHCPDFSSPAMSDEEVAAWVESFFGRLADAEGGPTLH